MINGKNANLSIKRIYFNQKERGTNGYGFVNISKGIHLRAKHEHEILGMLSRNPGSEILFHHRKPTSTFNSEETAHPICSNDNFRDHKYYLVHNGSIMNSNSLYSEHTDLKLKYETVCGETSYHTPIFNDSESLLFELALIIEGKKKEEEFAAYGKMAFILLQTDNDNIPLNMFYGRNEGKPLQMKLDNDKFSIASDIKGEELEPNYLFKFNYKDNVITKEAMIFPQTYNYSENSKLINNRSIRNFNNHSEIESFNERNNIMNFSDYNDGYYDDSSLSSKSEDSIQNLYEGFLTDLQSVDASALGETDKDELARLREERVAVESNLRKVTEEMNKRNIKPESKNIYG